MHVITGAGWLPVDPVSATYGEDATAIAAGFEFELCAECGGDIGDHAIGPDMFGNAHAWCRP
jgi:hypothetical protein